MLLCALLGAALVGGPFVVVSMHVRMAQQQYHLDQLHRDIEGATRENREAQAKVANMSSADWIVPQANRLGLLQPTRVQVLTIDEVVNSQQPGPTVTKAKDARPDTAQADSAQADSAQADSAQADSAQGSADATHP